MIRRLALILGVLACVVVGCGIPDNGKVSRIDDGQLGQLSETIPTTTTTTPTTTIEPTTSTIPINPTTTISTEQVTLYFISGGVLHGVRTPLPSGASASQVLAALQLGPPPGDLGSGLSSTLPTKDQAELKVTEDGTGVAVVDVPSTFYDSMSQNDQRFAIGQIVLTLTRVGGIGQVRFTQNGLGLAVPLSAGNLSAPDQALAPRDYQDLLDTATVTPTSTTTSTVTTVA
jgi:hypothetical protein